MPELDQINENLGALTSANQEIQDQMIMRDRRLSQEICQDLTHLRDQLVQIQEARLQVATTCNNGVCGLGDWRPKH